MLVGIIAYHVRHKNILTFVFIILVGLLMATNEPLLEKRMTYQTDYNNKWYATIDDELLTRRYALGSQGEYLPGIFFDNSYAPEYSKSLYKKIKSEISKASSSSYFQHESYYYKPLVIDGSGNVIVNYAYTPRYEMEITINENDSLVQMPLFYYPGYEIKITDISTGNSYEVDNINIDGLVSFKLSEGKYNVEVDYKGTTKRNVGKVLHILSCFISLFALFFEIVYKKKKGKKENGNTQNKI